MRFVGHSDIADRLLATTGAALAGVGIGALFADRIGSLGLVVLATGLIAHGVGMVRHRQAQDSTGYRQASWEIAAYWICWVLIAALIFYVASDALGTW